MAMGRVGSAANLQLASREQSEIMYSAHSGMCIAGFGFGTSLVGLECLGSLICLELEPCDYCKHWKGAEGKMSSKPH